jgi:hypothetical protein
MKYIITENRLNEFMFHYLDNWLSSKRTYDYDQFIIIEELIDEDGESAEIEMEYDGEDGRLWFDKNFRTNLMDICSKTNEEINQLIKEWFEYKFGVVVIKVIS